MQSSCYIQSHQSCHCTPGLTSAVTSEDFAVGLAVLVTRATALPRMLLLPDPRLGLCWQSAGEDNAWAERPVPQCQLPARLRRGLQSPKSAPSVVGEKDRVCLMGPFACLFCFMVQCSHPPPTPPKKKGASSK